MNPITVARDIRRALRFRLESRNFRRALANGKAAGRVAYENSNDCTAPSPRVEILLRADCPDAPSSDTARVWCARQTLTELVAIGFNQAGHRVWSSTGKGKSTDNDSISWFAAPGFLPEVHAAHLESCLMVAAAERVDAVVLLEAVENEPPNDVENADSAHSREIRPWTLYRSDAYAWDPATDEVRPTRTDRLVKVIGAPGMADPPYDDRYFNRFRRGPYLSTVELGPVLEISVAAPPILETSSRPSRKPSVLVLAPFLACGGAEQPLYEIIKSLTPKIQFSIATLAPHRSTLGDRRNDFRGITDHLYSLGDHVHPDAMYGMLLYLIDSCRISTVYNANGSTLFYDFVPRLRRDRPRLRVVDHLYDHHIGYIDRYTADLLVNVDVCVAENHLIRAELVERRDWPMEKVPVIWPCGRADEDLPGSETRHAIRKRLREQLDIGDDDVLFLTAARMHEQKRPLDLVALAARVYDLDHVQFLLVGGGDLEAAVDDAIAAGPPSRIRRLAFRDDIPDLILAADVGVLVSDFEGLPVFMLECLQLGRPFLGTRVGDLGRVLDETGAGMVVDRPGDLDELETAVRRLADAEYRSQLAHKALRAAPRFSVESCADAYGAVFLGVD